MTFHTEISAPTEVVEFTGSPEQVEDHNLLEIDFTAAVRGTHERVHHALRERVSVPDNTLRFFSDWTGRGKTSGVVLATGDLFEAGLVNRVLFITREISGVDDVWRHFAATYPQLNSVGFSSAHRDWHQKEVEWSVYRNDVTAAELKRAQVVVTTHSMAKNWMASGNWQAGQDFDLVIVDEYPDPVKADSLTHAEILGLRHEHCSGRWGVSQEVTQVWQEVVEWSYEAYHGARFKKAYWLDKVLYQSDSYPERLVKLAEAAKAGRLFATRHNGQWTVLQWADLAVPFEHKAIILSATNSVEGWQFDPSVTQKRFLPSYEQPTNYEGLTVTFSEWPDHIPTDNRRLGEHLGASLSAIEKAIGGLPQDGEPLLVLAPKSLCDAIPADWLDRMTHELRGGAQVHLNNWGAGIGSNAYKDCYHMVIFGLYHPNNVALKENVMGHKRYQSEEVQVGSFEDKAMQIAKSNHHKRWVIQMLNRIRIRKMRSGEADLDMYKAQDANIVWTASDKEQDIATEILTTSFRGCHITTADDVSLFEDEDEPEVVARKKTTEGKVSYILTKLDREGMSEVSIPEVVSRFGWKPQNKKARDKTTEQAKAMGWQYVAGTGSTPAQLVRVDR